MDTITIKNKKFILVPEREFRRLARKPARKGNLPAVAFAEESIAQNIVERREAAGLSQKDLAARAGIRVEVLNRAERGVVIPSIRTLTKIENALAAAK